MLISGFKAYLLSFPKLAIKLCTFIVQHSIVLYYANENLNKFQPLVGGREQGGRGQGRGCCSDHGCGVLREA